MNEAEEIIEQGPARAFYIAAAVLTAFIAYGAVFIWSEASDQRRCEALGGTDVIDRVCYHLEPVEGWTR